MEKIGGKASKKAEKHEKIYKIKKKLGWLGWSLSNKFKILKGYNLSKSAVIRSIEKAKSD